MDCLFTQHLFINSAHRAQGTPCHYSIVVPAGALSCDDDQLLGVSLMRFSAYRDWAGIPAGDNTVTLATSQGSQTVAISPGNPSNAAIAAQLSANALSVAATWDGPSNTLVLSCPYPLTLTCSATLGATLGFPSGSTGAAATLVKSATLRPPQVDQVVVRLEGMVPYADRGNLESAPGMMKASTLLCAFAADNGPYQHITYEQATEEFELIVDVRDINVLWFQITDYLGNELAELGDHTLALRVRTLKAKDEEALELQWQVVGLMKDQLLTQQLGM